MFENKADDQNATTKTTSEITTTNFASSDGDQAPSDDGVPKAPQSLV